MQLRFRTSSQVAQGVNPLGMSFNPLVISSGPCFWPFKIELFFASILNATWVDFDVKKGPKRLPNRIQNGAKIASKVDQQIRLVSDRS